MMRFWILDFGFWIGAPVGPRRLRRVAERQIQNRKSKIQNAFTLVELLLSIGLVLLLLVGISQVFRMSGETVGAGQALSSMTRDIAAAKDVMNQDFTGLATDAPFLLMCSQMTWAYASQNDRQADRDDDVRTIDIDGSAVEGDIAQERIPACAITGRSHRTDRLILFARGRFPRHTGNDGQFASPRIASESCIYYGHVNLPSPPASGSGQVYWYPGQPSVYGGNQNVNNLHASQWVLGRVAMVLQDAASLGSDIAIARQPNANTLSPLAYGSVSTDGLWVLQQSRYDLAGATMAQVAQDIRDQFVALGRDDWWRGLVYEVTGRDSSGRIQFSPNKPMRFECDLVVSRPMTSAGMARTMPCFLRRTTQFIVEYAGDYLTQSPDGSVTALAADGTVDFVIDRGVRRTRWYGRPRDVNGDGIILGGDHESAALGGGQNTPEAAALRAQRMRDLVDVVPLRDFYTLLNNSRTKAAFEKEVPDRGANGTSYERYMDQYDPAFNNYQNRVDAQYTCVWAQSDPWPAMLRVLLRLDDPAARVKEGQWAEMTFTVR